MKNHLLLTDYVKNGYDVKNIEFIYELDYYLLEQGIFKITYKRRFLRIISEHVCYYQSINPSDKNYGQVVTWPGKFMVDMTNYYREDKLKNILDDV